MLTFGWILYALVFSMVLTLAVVTVVCFVQDLRKGK